MGFFSYITQDTNVSVTTQYYEGAPQSPHTKTAYLIDNLGNAYGGVCDGYGRFMTIETFTKTRELYESISTKQSKKARLKIHERLEKILASDSYTYDCIYDKMNANGGEKLHPNVVEDCESEWVNKEPPPCPEQGYFYGW